MIVIEGHNVPELNEVKEFFTVEELAMLEAYHVKHLSTVKGGLAISKLTTNKPDALISAQAKDFWAEDDGVDPVYTDEEAAAVAFYEHVHNVIVSVGGDPAYNYVVVA